MNKLFFLLPTLAALAASPAWSQASAAHDHGHDQAKSAAPAAGTAADGEVRKVDKANGKVTIKHGEIKALNMPPMTMVYPVTDPAMLDGVKAGDKVKFTATSDGGKLTVTGIKPAK
jgi:Cu(I)/Ag(I) efflux system protein CusF